MTFFRTYRTFFVLLVLVPFLVFLRTSASAQLVRKQGAGHAMIKVCKSGSLSSDLLLAVNERIHPLPSPVSAKSVTITPTWDPDSKSSGYCAENQVLVFLSSLSGQIILHQTCRLQI